AEAQPERGVVAPAEQAFGVGERNESGVADDVRHGFPARGLPQSGSKGLSQPTSGKDPDGSTPSGCARKRDAECTRSASTKNCGEGSSGRPRRTRHRIGDGRTRAIRCVGKLALQPNTQPNTQPNIQPNR